MINPLNKPDQVKTHEMENVENEQQEYKLVGKFMRNRSLKLFSYNHMTEELLLVDETRNDEVTIGNKNGKLQVLEQTHTEANINTHNTHFEAMNMKSATRRVEKFQSGKIKTLDNLRIYDPKPLLSYESLSLSWGR